MQKKYPKKVQTETTPYNDLSLALKSLANINKNFYISSIHWLLIFCYSITETITCIYDILNFHNILVQSLNLVLIV